MRNYQIRAYPFNTICIVLFHLPGTPVPFQSITTLAFPPRRKNPASPAVNSSCLQPSYLRHLQPSPLLHSQSARAHSYKTTFRSSISFFRIPNASSWLFFLFSTTHSITNASITFFFYHPCGSLTTKKKVLIALMIYHSFEAQLSLIQI